MTMSLGRYFLLALFVTLMGILYFTLDWQEHLGKMAPMLRYNLKRQEIQTSHNNSLPEVAINPRVWHKYPDKKWQGLQLPVLTSRPEGRLGNVMGEYATLYAMGRIYGATVRQHPGMVNQLITIFPKLSMLPLPGNFNGNEWKPISYLTFLNYAPSEAAAAGILGPERFLLTGYPFEIQLFNTFRNDILKEFTFSENFQNQVREFWEAKKLNASSIVVGIHVRRTDYVNFIKMFNSLLPEDAYFKRATDYYREKYPGVQFIVASDDMAYVNKAFANYSDVVFAPGSPRELDMAVLSSCNHSIITVGSYGFWCGYLTGGEVVYPNISTREDYQFQRNWYNLGHLDFFTGLEPY